MSIKIRAIRTCLDSIAEQVNDSVPRVNCGGCAVYANELAKRLSLIGVNDYTLRVYSYDADNPDVTEVERNFHPYLPRSYREWNDDGVYFVHVRLQWNGRLWDVEGSVPVHQGKTYNGYPILPGHISRKALGRLTLNRRNWNDYFPRIQIPVMRQIMRQNFAELTGTATHSLLKDAA